MSKQEVDLNPENWVERYADYLYAVACFKLNDKEFAKDLVSETFLSALQGVSTFKGESSEKTWLTAILNNKIIDHYRKSKRGQASTLDYLNETEEQFYSSFFEVTSANPHHWKTQSSPTNDSSFTLSMIESKEFDSIIQFCLSKIPPKLRPVFIARFIDDINSEEICKEFELTSSNFWVIIHRAKLLMRECLEKNWLKE